MAEWQGLSKAMHIRGMQGWHLRPGCAHQELPPSLLPSAASQGLLHMQRAHLLPHGTRLGPSEQQLSHLLLHNAASCSQGLCECGVLSWHVVGDKV